MMHCRGLRNLLGLRLISKFDLKYLGGMHMYKKGMLNFFAGFILVFGVFAQDPGYTYKLSPEELEYIYTTIAEPYHVLDIHGLQDYSTEALVENEDEYGSWIPVTSTYLENAVGFFLCNRLSEYSDEDAMKSLGEAYQAENNPSRKNYTISRNHELHKLKIRFVAGLLRDVKKHLEASNVLDLFMLKKSNVFVDSERGSKQNENGLYTCTCDISKKDWDIIQGIKAPSKKKRFPERFWIAPGISDRWWIWETAKHDDFKEEDRM